MNPLDDLDLTSVPLDDGGTLLLDLVAAVDYLRRGVFPGFTVWDAIEQALRWHANIEADFTDPDPLVRALRLAMFAISADSAATLSVSLRSWLAATAEVHNESLPWRRT